LIYSKYAGRAVSLLALLPLMLNAQRVQESVVPLRNWGTPLYWHPNQAEGQVTAKTLPQSATPQLLFPGNAVSTDALTFVAITPCRLVDTRGAGAGFNGGVSPFDGPSITGAETVTFPLQSSTEATDNTTPAPCGAVPIIAQAYSFNVTAIPHDGGAVDYITLWPTGSARPAVSNINDTQGLIVANAAIVAAGTLGSVNLYNSGPATINVIIDMNGYFAAPTDLNENTAIGEGTLAINTGVANTATGAEALAANTTGQQNTANGAAALQSNTTGSLNTAIGYLALIANTTGSQNTAVGRATMGSNTTGMQNTANGVAALFDNTSGGNNTASGAGALFSNTTGGNNTASGLEALASNTTGDNNTASGLLALRANTTGGNNTAGGYYALQNNTTGSANIALGYLAGTDAPVGNSDSIYIGSPGTGSDTAGSISIGTAATETTGTIQIGSAQAGGTYIAGIFGANSSSGVEVYVNSSGQLGTALSSGRFKEQITDMGDSSSKLLQLRPVNFFYKPEYDDGSHMLQYGLIAEEVAKVYPEMVAYSNDGRVLTVKYQLLAPMLLNELQKQTEQIRQQAEQNRELGDRLTALEALLPAATASGSPTVGGQVLR
jgi:hypothetical protein